MDKKSIIVMGTISAILIAAFTLLFVYIKNDKSYLQDKENKEKMNAPIIELTLSTKEPTTQKIIINIETYVMDGSKIKMIILPNKREVISADTVYEIKTNGTYEFEVIAENGKKSKKSIEVTNIIEPAPDNPYIPDGFKHLPGTNYTNGYTIIDKNQNEFVWVPVPSGIVERENSFNYQYIENLAQTNDFITSVKENYGFYIARYEASRVKVKGKETIASKFGNIPLSSITYDDAKNKSIKMANDYEYVGVKTAIMNSYAYDTTLKWIEESNPGYSENLSYGNYSGTILSTGATYSDEVNNICDLAGNLREWTSEQYVVTSMDPKIGEIQYRILRGGSAEFAKPAKSDVAYQDLNTNTFWGFRTILYKNPQ